MLGWFLSLRTILLALSLSIPAWAQAQDVRYPGAEWLRYTNVEDAGFDPAKLAAARQTWEAMPSSAFLVIADGAVVASWGEVGRRLGGGLAHVLEELGFVEIPAAEHEEFAFGAY